MLGRAIVPEGERAWAPAEPAGEFGTDLMLEQEVQDRRALGLGHALEVRGMRHIDIEAAASGLGMGANDGMLGEIVRSLSARPADHVLACMRNVRLGRGVDTGQCV